MTRSDELVCQPVDDALCAAVKLRRHAFGKRRDLCNSHRAVVG